MAKPGPQTLSIKVKLNSAPVTPSVTIEFSINYRSSLRIEVLSTTNSTKDACLFTVQLVTAAMKLSVAKDELRVPELDEILMEACGHDGRLVADLAQRVRRL